MLNLSNMNVRYGMHQALASVDLQVANDEIVVILGANGAGKSTLLSAIAGNCAGEVDGVVNLDGEQILGLDAAQVVERGIAFVPEGRGVFADLSVEENLQLGSYTEHARRSEQDNLQNVLSLFPKLEERKKQIVRTMSGGEQQMVAIGRALMSAPSILMLDEPSLGLSPLLCKELFSSLKKVRDSGVGILLVEQNAKQSLSISDRGYLLANGAIIGHDSADNLLKDSSVQAAYLGGAMASGQARPITRAPASVVAATTDASTPSSARPDASMIPKIVHRPAQTLSADSLLNEDIGSLVARAGSSATRNRDVDASLPVQVVKLSNRKVDAPAPTTTLDTATGGTGGLGSINLPEHQDSRVQALLDEFEAAARNAAGGNNSSLVAAEPAQTHSARDDHSLPLPHIPVYKKSAVTVYRRDSAGKLRKEDKV
ncbi:MAG: ABC transporter ATP-binding protein [Granulosicoccus sp.]|nr:ABC transporter ATP-binding protein [Granulosicoccus sp.]